MAQWAYCIIDHSVFTNAAGGGLNLPENVPNGHLSLQNFYYICRQGHLNDSNTHSTLSAGFSFRVSVQRQTVLKHFNSVFALYWCFYL